MQAFFKGGDISVVNAGTDTAVDQPIKLSGETLVPLGKYGISAVTLKNHLGATMVQNSGLYCRPRAGLGLRGSWKAASAG